MRSIFVPQIPAPLANESFLRASHYKLGFDQRPEGSTVFSPYRTDYPPRWGTYQRQPILPPKCAGVLNQDMGNFWDTRSETYVSYPTLPLEPKSAICPPASRFQMHADPRHSILTSITRESYPYPSTIPHITLNRVDKWDDSVPSGDKEKEPLPDSFYQQSYPAYKEVLPAVKAPSQHLGGFAKPIASSNLLKGGSVRQLTSMKTNPNGDSCLELHLDNLWNVVSIVFGDPQCHQVVSEQKHAYTVQKPEGQRYDPNIASETVHHSNIQPGDGQHRFSTMMSESYLWKQPGPPSHSGPKKNESFIFLGDQGGRRKCINMTNYQFYYKEPNAKDLVNQPLIRPLTKLRLGDTHLLPSFNTTQHFDYQPPPEMHKLDSKNKTSTGSSICFNYQGPGTSSTSTTTTQDMLVPHQEKRYQLTEEELQKIKYSHLIHPWKGQRWFSTEQKDAYPEKYSGPITLATADFQGSNVPLGTMVKYQPRKKFVL
ncbi:stabilizer of axonemal microtubules 5 [Liasis olivaceus]